LKDEGIDGRIILKLIKDGGHGLDIRVRRGTGVEHFLNAVMSFGFHKMR
jgi:hypothetical protein